MPIRIVLQLDNYHPHLFERDAVDGIMPAMSSTGILVDRRGQILVDEDDDVDMDMWKGPIDIDMDRLKFNPGESFKDFETRMLRDFHLAPEDFDRPQQIFPILGFLAAGAAKVLGLIAKAGVINTIFKVASAVDTVFSIGGAIKWLAGQIFGTKKKTEQNVTSLEGFQGQIKNMFQVIQAMEPEKVSEFMKTGLDTLKGRLSAIDQQIKDILAAIRTKTPGPSSRNPGGGVNGDGDGHYATQDQIDEIMAKINGIDLSVLTKGLEGANALIAEHTMKLQSLESKLSTLQQDFDQLKNTRAPVSMDHTKMLEGVAKLKADLAEVKNELSTHKTQFSPLLSKVTSFETSITSLESSLSSLTGTLGTVSSDVETLKSSVSTLTQRIESLPAGGGGGVSGGDVAKINRDILANKNDLGVQKDQLNNLNTLLTTLGTTTNQNYKEISDLTSLMNLQTRKIVENDKKVEQVSTDVDKIKKLSYFEKNHYYEQRYLAEVDTDLKFYSNGGGHHSEPGLSFLNVHRYSSAMIPFDIFSTFNGASSKLDRTEQRIGTFRGFTGRNSIVLTLAFKHNIVNPWIVWVRVRGFYTEKGLPTEKILARTQVQIQSCKTGTGNFRFKDVDVYTVLLHWKCDRNMEIGIDLCQPAINAIVYDQVPLPPSKEAPAPLFILARHHTFVDYIVPLFYKNSRIGAFVDKDPPIQLLLEAPVYFLKHRTDLALIRVWLDNPDISINKIMKKSVQPPSEPYFVSPKISLSKSITESGSQVVHPVAEQVNIQNGICSFVWFGKQVRIEELGRNPPKTLPSDHSITYSARNLHRFASPKGQLLEVGGHEHLFAWGWMMPEYGSFALDNHYIYGKMFGKSMVKGQSITLRIELLGLTKVLGALVYNGNGEMGDQLPGNLVFTHDIDIKEGIQPMILDGNGTSYSIAHELLGTQDITIQPFSDTEIDAINAAYQAQPLDPLQPLLKSQAQVIHEKFVPQNTQDDFYHSFQFQNIDRKGAGPVMLVIYPASESTVAGHTGYDMILESEPAIHIGKLGKDEVGLGLVGEGIFYRGHKVNATFREPHASRTYGDYTELGVPPGIPT